MFVGSKAPQQPASSPRPRPGFGPAPLTDGQRDGAARGLLMLRDSRKGYPL